jgi:hypothetical protein
MKRLVTLTLALVLVFPLLLGGHAWGQSYNSYGSSGQYLGNARSNGGTTNFYGSSGQYLGNARSYGGTFHSR